MRWFSVGLEAHGVIAIGQLATGVIAVGQGALGVVAIGQAARGVVAFGQLALGGVAFGQLAVGAFWAGGMVAVAPLAGPGLLVLGVLGRLRARALTRRPWAGVRLHPTGPARVAVLRAGICTVLLAVVAWASVAPLVRELPPAVRDDPVVLR